MTKFSLNKYTILLSMLLLFCLTASVQAQDQSVEALADRARNAGISGELVDEMIQRGRSQGVSDQQLSEVLNIAIEMSNQNLPADLAIQKSLEGFSKGVPASRIVPVLNKVHQSVGEAAKVVDPWMKSEEVQQMVGRSSQTQDHFRNELTKATSKSFMQDLPSDAVSQVLEQIGDNSVLNNAGPADIIAAMGILPDLPQAKNNPQESGTFLVRALKGGFKADELQKLPSAMQFAQQRSELPAASVVQGVANQMRGNIPAKQILKNLFNGKVGGGPPGDIPKGLKNNKGRGNGNSNGT